MTRNSIWLVAMVAVAWGCGDDDGEECARSGDGAVVTESCNCADGGTQGQRECQLDGTWSECECGPGNQAGSSANAGTGTGSSGQSGGAGTTGGKAGAASEDDDAGMTMTPSDAGTTPDTDAGMTATDGGSTLPPATGERLSPCESNEDGACADGLVCYRRGFGPGFCTQPCEGDEDCADLTDATYTCSSAGGGNGNGNGNGPSGMCRVECEGEDDTTSCPGELVCLSVIGGGQGQGGAFRCGYPAEDDGPGGNQDGDVPVWGACSDDDECMGDLVCYGSSQGGGGGDDVSGYCTSSCDNTDDCTTPQSSGDIAPTCGNQNLCRFDCSEGGTCPDGMQCIEDRCLYSEG